MKRILIKLLATVAAAVAAEMARRAIAQFRGEEEESEVATS